MARGRRLKKVGGDLEAQKQSVASLKLTIREKNVPLELGVDESSSGFSLELANNEITPNIDWEFQLYNGGLDYFKVTYIKLNAHKKKLYKSFKFNYTRTFHHLMEGVRFFFRIFIITKINKG